MDENVHAGHREGSGIDLLSTEAQRSGLRGGAEFVAEAELTFDEQSGRAAGGIVDFFAGLRIEDAGHEHGNFARGVELAGALSLSFGELADEVFVGAAEKVRLDVLESEAVLREQLNERAQLVVAEDALAGGGLVEVLNIDDAVQARVLAGDGADDVGQQLAESGGLLLQIRPARAGRDIEAYEFVVLVNEAGAGAEAIEVVLVNVGEALEEDERKDVVLELGASMGLRMMQAASQSQDSRAEMSSTAAGMRGGIIAWGVEISA